MPRHPTTLRACPAPPAAVRRPPGDDMAALLSGARRGDERAWAQLVRALDDLPRSVARSLRLTPADADDVAQSTWLALFEHLDAIRDADALRSWVWTTARRNGLRLLQRPLREELTDDPRLADGVDRDGPDVEVLAAERRAILATAIGELPERHRSLMMLLSDESDLDYREISRALGVPRGSIGPIRGRSLERLRRNRGLRLLRAVA